jgi:hypothetical protein
MRLVHLARKPENPVKIRICEYRRNMRGRCPMSGTASHFWQSGAIRVADGTQGYVRANDTKESTGTAAARITRLAAWAPRTRALFDRWQCFAH